LVKADKVADETIFTIKNIFGQYESSLHVFSRSLAENISKKFSSTKPLLISLGLKKEQLEKFDLLKFIESNILESYHK
jgi:hypothetical protein